MNSVLIKVCERLLPLLIAFMIIASHRDIYQSPLVISQKMTSPLEKDSLKKYSIILGKFEIIST